MVGMALALRHDKKANRVYGLLGDGECQEGQVWEAAMAAGHFKLSNLCIFIDKNGLQIDGATSDVMNIDPLADKFKAFGWDVVTIDGHNIHEIVSTLEHADALKDRPLAIIANTVKGKGVTFMENQVCYHGAPITDEQLVKARCELDVAKGVYTCHL
jgi:transketolase